MKPKRDMLHLFVIWRTDTIFADRVRFDNQTWRNLCDPAGYALRVSGKKGVQGMIVKVVRVCQDCSLHSPTEDAETRSRLNRS